MANDIQPGDVVRLKGGSPAMTVTSIARDSSGLCWCAWFDGYDLKTTSINRAALVKSEKAEE